MQLKASVLVPIAAVMNYHKLRSLKDTNLLLHSSAVQKFEMGLTRLKSRCGHGCISFWRLPTFLGLRPSTFTKDNITGHHPLTYPQFVF